MATLSGAALAGSVRAMAEWLDVDVAVGERGDLADDLRVAVS